MFVQAIAVLCVVGIAIGQILFKVSANLFEQTGNYFSLRPTIIVFVALIIYGLSTLIWIWVLQKVELGRVYPLMAIAFVLVPVCSHVIFGEKLSTQYFVGIAFIVLGIFFAVKS